MKYILLEVPDTFPKCEGCPFYITLCDRDYCPLSKAKEAVEVKITVDHEVGASVIDSTGRFHFEGQDKYYAVEDK